MTAAAEQRAAIVSAVLLDVENEPMTDVFVPPTHAELSALADWMGAWDALLEHVDGVHDGVKGLDCRDCRALGKREDELGERLERIEHEATAVGIGRAG